MLETLAVSIDEDRALGTVGVSANADLGGTLLSRWFLSYAGPPDGMRVDSGAEGSLGATEVVLVIDVTGSMLDNLDGVRVDSDDSTSRINIVKTAAAELIAILNAHDSSAIAVGIVPWTYRVRLNQSTRTSWETDGMGGLSNRADLSPIRQEAPQGATCTLPETQSLPARNQAPQRRAKPGRDVLTCA